MRVLFVILGVLAACDAPKAPPNTAATPDAGVVRKPTANTKPIEVTPAPANLSKIRKLDGPMPGPETELASVGSYKVTLADFETAVRLGSLFSPDAATGQFDEVPADRLATPTVHFTTTHAVLSRLVIDDEIRRRGITLSQADIEAFFRANRYPGFVWLLDHPEERPKVLERLGLQERDFWSVGRDELARDRLTRLLLEEVTDEEMWNAWAFDHDTVTLAAIAVDNVPTSDEIDAFVAKQAKAIQTYFNENEARFRRPMRVIVDAVSSPKNDVDKLDQARAMLADGKDVMAVALALGLEAQQNVRLIRQENAKAFHGQPGDIGLEKNGARGAYAWRVTGFEHSDAGELNRGLQREIAAEMLRTKSPVPSVLGKLKKARKALAGIQPNDEGKTFTQAQKTVSDLGLSIQVLAAFPRNPNGAIPELGLAPEVLDAAFSLTVAKPTSPVILSRERAYVVHLLARNTPDEAAYALEKDAWQARYKKQLAQTIVDRFVQSKVGNPVLNLRPLAIKFGILKKD